MSKVKIGIVGLGSIGMVHAKAISAVSGAELVAVCDRCLGRLEEKGDELKVVDRYTDHRRMLEEQDLDAVIVAVPNAAHARVATDALTAGKHVLCEKPMALNARQAQAIVRAARAARRKLQIGMVWRHTAADTVARDYVLNGHLGRIYHMHMVLRRRRGVPGLGGWFTTKAQSGGGVLIDIGVHLFDLLLWLSDQWSPRSVSAATYSEFGRRMRNYVHTAMWAGPPRFDGVCDVDDYASGLVRFPKDATLSFELSWAANCEDEWFVELLGDRGGLRYHESKGLMLFTEHNGRLADIRPHFATTDQFAVQMRTFVESIHGKTSCSATGEQGVVVMKLIDAIYASAARGREVSVR